MEVDYYQAKSILRPAPRLTYLLAWEDLAQRQARWDAFVADPEWQQVVTETNARTGGSPIHTITNSILAPTSYSPEPLSDLQPSRLFGGAFELRSYACEDSAGLVRLSAWFRDHGIPHLEKHHVHPLGFWTTMIGIAPRFTYILVFESLAHRERAWASLLTDPAWSSLQDGLYQDGKPLIVGVESALMKGTTFSEWK